MTDTFRRNGLIGTKAVLTLAFGAAGLAKLIGVDMMVQTFDTIGFGQWFRYLTGVIEVGSAIGLWIPAIAAYSAALLVCTMIGAVLAHSFILGPSAVPALILGVLALIVLIAHRDQLGKRKSA